MKKIILTSIVAAFAVLAVQAQEIPDRNRDFKPMEKHRHHMKAEMKDLNLTDAQKAEFKANNEEFRKKMDELKKNENITVKEWKNRMETIRKEHQEKNDEAAKLVC